MSEAEKRLLELLARKLCVVTGFVQSSLLKPYTYLGGVPNKYYSAETGCKTRRSLRRCRNSKGARFTYPKVPCPIRVILSYLATSGQNGNSMLGFTT